jgi:hypothetical protein
MERLIKAAFSKDAVSHINEMTEQEFDTPAHHVSNTFEFKLLTHRCIPGDKLGFILQQSHKII